jgi:hypothetical protein
MLTLAVVATKSHFTHTLVVYFIVDTRTAIPTRLADTVVNI